MQLIQAKIRGTGATLETDWFQISGTITSVHISNTAARTLFLSALHSINPSVSSLDSRLFTNKPRLVRKNGHLRQIQPHKRTIAIAIYSTPPALVKSLGEISPHLYETDRIEVGRRLDRSRWMNFVEIASSTRWSEISSDILNLLAAGSPSHPLPKWLKKLKSSDRIKGKIRDSLLNLLDSCAHDGNEEPVQVLTEKIKRIDDFQKARVEVYRHLPRSFLLNNQRGWPVVSSDAQKAETFNLPPESEQLLSMFKNQGKKLDALRSQALKIIAETNHSDYAPLILLDSPEQYLEGHNDKDLVRFLEQLAEFGQVFFVTGDQSLQNRFAISCKYAEEDLVSSSRQEEMA